jgi:hypothetical protein
VVKGLGVLLALTAIRAAGEAFGPRRRWNHRPLQAGFAVLATVLLVAGCVLAGSAGPAILVAGASILFAARGGETSKQAVIGVCGIAIIIAGALVTRASG